MILMQHLSLSFLEKISSWWSGTLDRWGGKKEEGLTAQGPIYEGQAKTDSPMEIPSKQVELKDTSHFQWQALKNWRSRERRDGHYRSKFSTFYFSQREPGMHAERAPVQYSWSPHQRKKQANWGLFLLSFNIMDQDIKRPRAALTLPLESKEVSTSAWALRIRHDESLHVKKLRTLQSESCSKDCQTEL